MNWALLDRTGLAWAGCVFLVSAIVCGLARADEVQLRNGDRISGNIKAIESGKLIFETASIGSVKIPVDEIAALSSDAAVTIQFKDGGYATGRLSSQGDGVINLTGENDTRSEFRLAAVKSVYPGDKLPVPAFKWKGRINLGASQSSGNTDKWAVNADAEAKGRGEKDRIVVSGAYNRESSDGVDTADNARLGAKYDRFLSKKWYLGLQGSAEHDDFADLNLRTTIGAGAGYQIIETEQADLSIEAGPTYVNEDLQSAPDRDFIAGRWAVDFEIYVFDKFAQLFHNHVGLVNLERTSDVLIKTKQGARIPIRNSFNVAAQVNWDHDTEPTPGNKKNDTKYILSVGYNW